MIKVLWADNKITFCDSDSHIEIATDTKDNVDVLRESISFAVKSGFDFASKSIAIFYEGKAINHAVIDAPHIKKTSDAIKIIAGSAGIEDGNLIAYASGYTNESNHRYYVDYISGSFMRSIRDLFQEQGASVETLMSFSSLSILLTPENNHVVAVFPYLDSRGSISYIEEGSIKEVRYIEPHARVEDLQDDINISVDHGRRHLKEPPSSADLYSFENDPSGIFNGLKSIDLEAAEDSSMNLVPEYARRAKAKSIIRNTGVVASVVLMFILLGSSIVANNAVESVRGEVISSQGQIIDLDGVDSISELRRRMIIKRDSLRAKAFSNKNTISQFNALNADRRGNMYEIISAADHDGILVESFFASRDGKSGVTSFEVSGRVMSSIDDAPDILEDYQDSLSMYSVITEGWDYDWLNKTTVWMNAGGHGGAPFSIKGEIK